MGLILGIVPIFGMALSTSVTAQEDEGEFLNLAIIVPEGAATNVTRAHSVPSSRLFVQFERRGDGTIEIRLENADEADVRFETRTDEENEQRCGISVHFNERTGTDPIHFRKIDCVDRRLLKEQADSPPAVDTDVGVSCSVAQCYEFANLPFLAAGAVPDGRESRLSPLTIAKATDGKLILTWSRSCSATDNDYAIYSGPLVGNHDPMPVTCSTGGETDATIGPESGNRYYLVVPRNKRREGSYGVLSDGSERKPSTRACLAQLTAPCQ